MTWPTTMSMPSVSQMAITVRTVTPRVRHGGGHTSKARQKKKKNEGTGQTCRGDVDRVGLVRCHAIAEEGESIGSGGSLLVEGQVVEVGQTILAGGAGQGVVELLQLDWRAAQAGTAPRVRPLTELRQCNN